MNFKKIQHWWHHIHIKESQYLSFFANHLQKADVALEKREEGKHF